MVAGLNPHPARQLLLSCRAALCQRERDRPPFVHISSILPQSPPAAVLLLPPSDPARGVQPVPRGLRRSTRARPRIRAQLILDRASGLESFGKRADPCVPGPLE